MAEVAAAHRWDRCWPYVGLCPVNTTFISSIRCSGFCYFPSIDSNEQWDSGLIACVLNKGKPVQAFWNSQILPAWKKIYSVAPGSYGDPLGGSPTALNDLLSTDLQSFPPGWLQTKSTLYKGRVAQKLEQTFASAVIWYQREHSFIWKSESFTSSVEEQKQTFPWWVKNKPKNFFLNMVIKYETPHSCLQFQLSHSNQV